MENINYYPLRVGKHSSCIVSDICPGPMKKDRIDSDWEYYGGFLIAESIPSQVAKDLVDAYNEKYAPNRENAIVVNNGTERFIWKRDGSPDVIVYFPKPEDQAVCLLLNGNNSRFIRDNHTSSAHSFTEGMEMDSVTNDKEVFKPSEPTIDEQISVIDNRIEKLLLESHGKRVYKAILKNLKAIKRWNETPVYNGEIDVAKVIGDLMDVISIQVDNTALVGSKEAKKQYYTALERGERTIEMINRFKEEREVLVDRKENLRKAMDKIHQKLDDANKKEDRITPKDVAAQGVRDKLVKEVYHRMSGKVSGCLHIAEAIVFAIESMDHLKQNNGK